MKKLLQKAMVFTLAAAMLVGTPLTASAAPLNEVFQIEDGWGNVIGNGDNTATGTVTATQTNSGALVDANAKLLGISLDETDIELEIPDEAPLTVKLDWEDKEDAELAKKLNNKFTWKSGNTAIVAIEGKFNGGPRNTITLHPKAVGTTTVTVSLDNAEYDIHYSATATVTVVQYADELRFNDAIKAEALTGNSIVLDEFVDTYVGGEATKTSDVLTYALNTDTAGKNVTIKNNVVTIKPNAVKDTKFKVLAIGKKVRSDWYEITIKKGTNASKITFEGGNKKTIKVNEGLTQDVTAVAALKKGETGLCTDKIIWTSKKPEIVTVSSKSAKFDENNNWTATLTAKAAGKAQVVAKASSGKSATLTVTVSADLTKITISEDAPKKLYSGQTVDLYNLANQYFEQNGPMNFTDAGLKWSFVKADQAKYKKVASINAKGVLTIKADITNVKNGPANNKIKVVAANAKKVGERKAGEISAELEISLEQVNVTSITVKKGTTEIAKATAADGKITQVTKNKKDTISVGGNRIYVLEAKGTVGSETEVHALDSGVLGWTSSNGKVAVAGRDAESNGVIKGVKKGTVTITASSATKKGNKFVAMKTTFKETVNAPSKTLTLSVKNKGIAATSKNQNIKITAKLEKGTTTKAKDIVWGVTTDVEGVKVSGGKLVGNFKEGDVGKTVKVTARVPGGAGSSVTFTVVKPGSKVLFYEKDATKNTASLRNISKTETVNVKVLLAGRDKTEVVPGSDNYKPNVTYTVNKAGIVYIIDNKDGTITIEPLTKGSVKITATTPDGKKGTLSVSTKLD